MCQRNATWAVFAFLTCIAAGQSIRQRGELPEELKPSLETRLAVYSGAQRDSKWDVVASMLGRYRRGGTGDHLITPSQRKCMVEQMRTTPMTAFTYKSSGFSTEILNVPAEKRWWYIGGPATLKVNGQEKNSNFKFVAYRDRGQWYFSPPNIDEYWEKTHLADADTAADYANEIVIHNNPTCPLEITDLHAFLDKQYPSLRNLTFKITNRSRKRVRVYTLRLYSNGGEIIYGTPADLEPGASRADKMDSSRYVYFCDGVTKDNLIVDEVDFANGSEWHLSTQGSSAKGR
jgi:hypothetical protein